jgi:rubredoxin-NAD+ reductase
MAKWQCNICGWIYDEALGDPEHGIAPGTRFEDIPDDWSCPDCGVLKADFECVESAEAEGSTGAS